MNHMLQGLASPTRASRDDAQQHQRVVHEQIVAAAAHATSPTAAQMTARCRDIENHVEAKFDHQQRGLVDEIDSV